MWGAHRFLHRSCPSSSPAFASQCRLLPHMPVRRHRIGYGFSRRRQRLYECDDLALSDVHESHTNRGIVNDTQYASPLTVAAPIRGTPSHRSRRSRASRSVRTLGTDMQGHGTMKDAQQILRHASIKTTAEIYMQEIPASVRTAINSRTRVIFNQRSKELSQLHDPVSHQRRANSRQPQNATVPDGSKFVSERLANA